MKIDNMPREQKTFASIAHLAQTILDPIKEKFGEIDLTYGLCSHNLQKHIKKNVAPELDQHAGSEKNSKGKLICSREGFAVDFRIPNISTDLIAKFIVQKLEFDRLYFYGSDRPLHVSAAITQSKKAIVVFNQTNSKRTPKPLSVEQFFEFIQP